MVECKDEFLDLMPSRVERAHVDPTHELAKRRSFANAKATFEWLDRAWSSRDAGVQNLLYGPPRFADGSRTKSRSALAPSFQGI
jgi:hypothetical protein